MDVAERSLIKLSRSHLSYTTQSKFSLLLFFHGFGLVVFFHHHHHHHHRQPLLSPLPSAITHSNLALPPLLLLRFPLLPLPFPGAPFPPRPLLPLLRLLRHPNLPSRFPILRRCGFQMQDSPRHLPRHALALQPSSPDRVSQLLRQTSLLQIQKTTVYYS